VTRWLSQCEPIAEEVADVVDWLLKETRPALERFELGAAEVAERRVWHWRSTADALECALLREWESRSCDEISRQIEAVYTAAPQASAEHLPGENARVHLALGILKSALRQWCAWKTLGTAGDRATSVLIAALNTVLRSYRRIVQPWLVPPQPLVGGVDCPGRAKEGWQQTLHTLHKVQHKVQHRASSLTRIVSKKDDQERHKAHATPILCCLVMVAVEAARLAEFCQEAIETTIGHASSLVCTTVFTAFAGAFDRETASLCELVFDRHFAADHHDQLKGLKFGKDDSASITTVLTAATAFIECSFAGAPRLCVAHAGDAAVRLVVQRWVKQFRRCPPKLSANPQLPRAVAADEGALRGFARRFGSDDLWSSAVVDSAPLGVGCGSRKADPVVPLTEVRTLLTDSSQELKATAASRLIAVLGEDHGRALAKAVQLSAMH